ncbi:MAG TPA: ankyrin repeat domain-containing protein [Candidatus Babeliaceae bacterium]|nr:ankyrin repeat domain-containing protein [Candidatus Babeliaceae bacterium]
MKKVAYFIVIMLNYSDLALTMSENSQFSGSQNPTDSCFNSDNDLTEEPDLMQAIKTRDYQKLKVLLAMGSDPNARNKTASSLEHAIGLGDLTSIELLLQFGAHPTSQDCQQMLGIKTLWAKSENIQTCFQIYELLFKYGLDPHTANFDQVLRLGNRNFVKLFLDYGINLSANPKLASSSIFTSMYSGMLTGFVLLAGASFKQAQADSKFYNPPRKMLEQYASDEFDMDIKNLFWPVTYANLLGDLESFKQHYAIQLKKLRLNFRNLVKKVIHKAKLTQPSANYEDKLDLNMRQLHLAAAQGNIQILNFLLQQKTVKSKSLNTLNALDNYTVADRAVRNGHTECAQAILQAGGKFHSEHWLHAAVKRRDPQAIQNLLKANPELINEKDNNGNTPLHIAGAQPYTPVLNILLTDHVNLYILNKTKISPLQAIFANVCPGDLTVLAAKIINPVLQVFMKSTDVPIQSLGDISEIREYLGKFIYYAHIQKNAQNSKILQTRNLSFIKTVRNLRFATSIPNDSNKALKHNGNTN